MIDVDHQISTVSRRIGERTLEAGKGRVLTIGQTYNAGLDEVWDACTNAERIPRWFLPVEGDLQVGGHYQLQGNAGGTIERCDPPKSFAATWEYGGETSWIEVRLAPDPQGGTRFELEHVAHVDDERWTEFGPGAVGIGWDMAMSGLSLHLASGEAVDPAAYMQWVSTDEGKRFMTLSSDAWRDASIAAGTPEDEARAAADRIAAAYTADA